MLGSMLVLCIGVAGWLWVCAGLRRSGWRGVAGRLAVQVSALCLAYGVLRGQPMPGLFMALFPPLAVVFNAQLAGFGAFLVPLAWAVLPYAAGVAVVALALRPLRPWASGLAGLAAVIAVPFVGEPISRAAMCKAAALQGFDSFRRLSLADSLASGSVEPHAIAEVGGQAMGWSYLSMDWYRVPAGGDVRIMAEPYSCADG